MWSIFESFIADALNAIVNDVLTAFEDIMGDMMITSFFLEKFPGLTGDVLTTETINIGFNTLYSVLVLILAIKLLRKGWGVYVLWRDGDAETPPGEMVIGAAISIIISVGFPWLYEIALDIIQWILTAACEAMFGGDIYSGTNAVTAFLDLFLKPTDSGFVITVLLLVYAILLLTMMFISLKQGAEMLMFRFTVPFASIGWVDSDGGMWKPFMQAMFRQFSTVMIRYFFVFLSVRIITGLTVGNILTGTALLIVAISTPQILSQFMIAGKGGGFSQKVQTISMVVRAFGGG